MRRLSPSLVVVAAIMAGTALVGWHDAVTRNTGDVYLFAQAGSHLLSGRAFADPAVQSGPLQLALVWIAKSIGSSSCASATPSKLRTWPSGGSESARS